MCAAGAEIDPSAKQECRKPQTHDGSARKEPIARPLGHPPLAFHQTAAFLQLVNTFADPFAGLEVEPSDGKPEGRNDESHETDGSGRIRRFVIHPERRPSGNQHCLSDGEKVGPVAEKILFVLGPIPEEISISNFRLLFRFDVTL